MSFPTVAELFYGLGIMVILVVIGSVANLAMAQVPLKRRDIKRLRFPILVGGVAVAFRWINLLIPPSDIFLVQLLDICFTIPEIVVTSVLLGEMVCLFQYKPSWVREDTGEIRIILLGLIFILSVTLFGFHKSIYFACGILMILMGVLAFLTEVIESVHLERKHRRQQRAKASVLTTTLNTRRIRGWKRVLYQIGVQLIFSMVGIVLGNILINLH